MNRSLIFSLFLFFISANALAQQTTDFVFDQQFTRCEKKWVVLPKQPTENRYRYGYVYVDQIAGYTLDVKGFFTIDASNHYVDTQKVQVALLKVRLGPNTIKMALLPPEHFVDLKIKAEPDWLSSYYRPYSDTLMHNFRMGFNLNAAGDSETALTYLLPVYKIKPDFTGLAFELAYAYNVLKRGNDAVAVLLPAIKRDPKQIILYRELGFAYSLNSDWQKSVESLINGVDQCSDAQTDLKCELAFNAAITYRNSGHADEFKTWALKAKGWAKPNSNIYKTITSLGL